MPSESIILRPTITVPDGAPVSLTLEPSVGHYFASIKFWPDNKKENSIQLLKEKVEGSKTLALVQTPSALRASAALICDVLALPASFAKDEKFSFGLKFTQGGTPCAVSGSTVGTGTFAEDIVGQGGQLIHIICKFN